MISRQSVVLLGRKRKVEVAADGRAQVKLTWEELVTGHKWRTLPDEGCIRLSKNQVLEVLVLGEAHWCPVVPVEDALMRETSFARLKEQIADRLNDEQFESWLKPELPLPDPNDPCCVVPDIEVRLYGTCAKTGVPLAAFGVVAVKRSPVWEPELRLTSYWTPFARAAESLHEETLAVLAAHHGRR